MSKIKKVGQNKVWRKMLVDKMCFCAEACV